jgi:mannose-6-phosphate isomerase-like protein (cupin superfamily)
MNAYKVIPEYNNLDAPQFFQQIAPNQQPVVIRDIAKNWPVVTAANKSDDDFVNYLTQFYTGKKAKMVVAPPAANKRFFYNDDMTDVNFLSGEERVDLFLGRLLELVNRDVYPAISMQNSLTNQIFPGLLKHNRCDFFDNAALTDVEPRLWIGNEGIVSSHYDGSDNIACVIAGQRRFTLFPPEQTSNLYPGSLNFTPAGAPTSLVDLNDPDFKRFPRFKQALDNAYQVELNPGDAIFIPMLWWHHVESLSKVNALINLWWNGSSAPKSITPSPIDSLNIALLAMRDLTPKQRKSWRYMFDHYLFNQDIDPRTYIPEHQHHVLGKLSPEHLKVIKDHFANKLKQ